MAEFYQAPLLSADWQVTSTKLSCQLSHEIPHLGQAAFIQEAGEELRLQLSLWSEREVLGARVAIQPAPWRHGGIGGKPHPVTAIQSSGLVGQRLWVKGQIAETMLAALEQGQFPAFTYQKPLIEGVGEARVLVLAVNFQEAYDQFQRCRQRLPEKGLKDFRDLRFYYLEHQIRQPDFLARILPQAAGLLKVLGKGQVVITNLAAGVGGKEGERWFARRARSLKQALREAGLSARQIVVGDSPTKGIKPTIKMELLGPEGLRLYHYGRHQHHLTPSQQRKLQLLAKYVHDFFPGDLVIHGYSDAARWRKEGENVRQSKRWAERIRDYLIDQGVDRKRLQVRAWGSRKRLASNRSRAGQQKNRRVWIEMRAIPNESRTAQKLQGLTNCCTNFQSSTVSTSMAASG